MNFKSLVASTIVAFSAFGANATTTLLGAATVGTPLSFNSGLVPNGNFDDYFTFTLPTNGGAGFSVINFNIPGLTNASFTSGSLFSNADGTVGNGDDTNLGSFTGTASALELAKGPLTAGSYYINVKGLANGVYGGTYNGSISIASVTAVPEPETFAMLLAGLGLMGAIARRRNKANA